MRANPQRADASPEWLGRFRELGAIWEANGTNAPHVKTSLAGAHVDRYFNSDAVMASPDITTEIVRTVLLPELRRRGTTPDWVVGYAPFGLFLAHAAAHALGGRCAYSDPAAEYHTYFDIRPSESVLVVADDMYSGGSVTKTIEQIETREATVIPVVFCLVNLSGKPMLGAREIVSVATLSTNIYPAEACPLCKTGSLALIPRPNWDRLASTPHAMRSPTDTETGQTTERL